MSRMIFILTILSGIMLGHLPIFAEGNLPHSSLKQAEYDRLRVDGFIALYNLNYSIAKNHFTKMIELEPNNPAGYVYSANNLWLEKLNESKKLQTGLYNDDSFYEGSKEKIDLKLDKEFRSLIAKAIEKAQTGLKKNSKNVDLLYYIGASYGALAAYEATVAHSFMSSLRNGSKSIAEHHKVLDLDPTFADANLTIGMYNYVVGSLPFPVKILAAVGGFHGSKKRGVELLSIVTEKGRYAQDDARVILIGLYKRDHQYEKALKELQILSEKYKENYLIKMEIGDALIRLGRHDESFQVFSKLLETPKADHLKDIIEYQYAEALFSQETNSEALKHFKVVVNLKNANTDLTTLSYLRIGQLLDLTNYRKEAMENYKIVINRNNVLNSLSQANEYLKSPYLGEKIKNLKKTNES